jgi:DNA-binding PucR family transcriptional regulator
MLRVRDLLDVPGLGLRLLTDVTGMERAIKHVYTTDLPDPGRYLTQDDLVLTGMIWCREPGDADRFVRALVKAGAGVIGAGEALGPVPPEVINACGRHGVALLAVPPETSFASVTDEVARRLNGDRATAMTRVLGRRRLLLSAVAEGAGLDQMFRLMGREIGLQFWLFSGAGRVVGGTGAAPPRPLALRFAAEYLRADRLPVVTRGTEDERYSLFGVGGEPRITSWFLACAGREQDWPHELRESVAELTADVALERARLGAGRAGDRRLAEAIVAGLADEGTAPAEIASLMRAAGLPPDGRYLVVAMHAEAEGRMAGATAAGPGQSSTAAEGPGQSSTAAERWRCDLVEELAVPMADHALMAPLGDEIIVLVPLASGGPGGSGGMAPPGKEHADGAPDGGASNGDTGAAHEFADRLREMRGVFEADRSRLRLTVGVSAPASGVAALPGALHEARSAQRLAALPSGSGVPAALAVVTSDEVASHELLLASVPGSVLRSFRERLLGPLVAYDAQHRAELLPTLREFLDCSGSWNACAARMYVHVNTVRYRIRRIEELTGRDLSTLDDRVDFFLALRVR